MKTGVIWLKRLPIVAGMWVCLNGIASAQVLDLPRPIAVTDTFNKDGSETVKTVLRAKDVYLYEAEVLGSDYRTYMKARKKIGSGPKWRTWRDPSGHDWTRSGTTTCRFKGEFGTCVSH